MTAVFSYQLIKQIFLFVIFVLLFTTSAFAQEIPLTPTTFETTNNDYIPSQSPHTASLAIYNFGHALSCIIVGQSPISPCLEYKFVSDAQGMIKSVPVLSSVNTSGGLLGMSLSMIGEVIGNPPVNSSLFIADLGEQIGIKSANAQVSGSGSGVLAPIFKLWEVSRNIAYLVMILIFVIVGLMVMFRQKLNPQTVVTVQMALPGLVIGLVMITFSYFFASLISDLAFVGTNVVGYYFSLADPTISTPTQLPLIEKSKPGILGTAPTEQEANVLTIFSRYTGILGVDKIWGALSKIWPYLDDPNRGELPLLGGAAGLAFGMDPEEAIGIFANFVAIQVVLPFGSLFGGKGQSISALIPTLVSAIPATPWTPSGTQVMVALTLSFLAMLALIYTMFKLLFKLISNFLNIIFLTIASPFIFLAASIPGRQKLVTDWAQNMLCNVLAFPAVFAVFYFVAFLLKGKTSSGTEPLFAIGSGVSSITGSATFPLLGGFDLGFLNLLIAFGALLATPSIPDMICKTVGKPSQSGALLAGAIGASIGQGQKYQGQVQSGTAGFAGNVGRISGQPGYFGHMDSSGKVTWTKSGDPRFGGQIGQGSKIRGGLAEIPYLSTAMSKIPFIRHIPQKIKVEENPLKDERTGSDEGPGHGSTSGGKKGSSAGGA